MNPSNKEREIGSTFVFNGVTLEVTKCRRQKPCGCDCTGCYAYTSTTNEKAARHVCNSLGVEGGWCGRMERTDRTDIIFKQIQR